MDVNISMESTSIKDMETIIISKENPKGDIFIDADAAAYRVKNAGGAGCAFHE